MAEEDARVLEVEDDAGFRLEPPGAGLRFWEQVVVRRIVFPWCRVNTSWDGAMRLFHREGERILGDCGDLPTELLFERVLVPRLFGIEDSSRYWSPAMVLEHLTMVGTRMGEIIVALSKHRPARPIVDMKDMKPSGRAAEDIVQQFGVFLKVFAEAMEERVEDRGSDCCCRHPRFGALDAHGWCCLAALHQRLHRRHLDAILRNLRRKKAAIG
jgi:hypothetical protein